MGEIKRLKRANQFGQIYEIQCSQKSVSPLATIQANLTDNRLRFCCDRVRLEDWSPILNSLAADRSLVEIHVYSLHRRKKIHETIDIPEKLDEYRCFVDAVAVCARDSTILTSLSLDGIPLADGKYLDILCTGLANNRSLRHLSLARCRIGDEGCRVLLGAILEDTLLRIIDLTACSLTSKSAGFLTSFLKNKRIKLLDYIWHQTGIPNSSGTEANHGLQTLVLDQNRKFGDDGLRLLARTLKDDFWLKKLSVRHCGLTEVTGDVIIDLLETNSIIEAMNFKNNEIPVKILKTIRRLLKRRQNKGESIPLNRRLFNRSIGTASKKKRTKNRKNIQRGYSKVKNSKIRENEGSVSNGLNLLQLNDRLSNVIDCNRNLTRDLANERQLLVSEKLSRLDAERSYQLLRPVFNNLLQGIQKQDRIRGKIQLESNLCANLRKIFNRLECISAKNVKSRCEPSEKCIEIEHKVAMIDNSSLNRFDGKRRIIRSARKRPHCPPRQKV